MMRKLLIYAMLVFVTAFYIGPFVWMIVTSMKTTAEAAAVPPTFLPLGYQPPKSTGAGVPVAATVPASAAAAPDAAGRVVYPELEARHIPPTEPPLMQRLLITKYNYYDKVLTDPAFDFALYARNTLLIALGAVAGSVVSSSLVAYSLTKLEWYGKNVLFGIVLATMMLPFTVFMVPHYVIFKWAHLIGTNVPLWGPTFFGVPFFIFLLRQFYLTIPNELLDAARIDGCSEFRIWWQIMLPLSRPALAVVALFAFMGAWNDFLGPLVYLVHKQQFTLSLALQFFQSRSGGTSWELLMAASVLVILPVVALFFLAQRTFIQGIATTGMKG